MHLSDLAKRIRGQREKRGLKQQDIAHALGISPQAVSKWERGENAPDIAALAPLARLLGVSVDWILAAKDEAKDVFEATVFATSVSGAHKRSLTMPPRDFALWANGLFYQLTELTLRFDGVPVKYMGDRYLGFFSGARHRERALEAAAQARAVISEDLRIGLSSGDIYLGSVGHPDYARPDIMGEVVNTAFLTLEWAEEHSKQGAAASGSVKVNGHGAFVGKGQKVSFLNTERTVEVFELKLK